MIHRYYFMRGITIFLVMLFVTGCTASGADLSATIAPQTCPTAAPLTCPTNVQLSCPTTSMCPTTAPAQSSSNEDLWSKMIGSAVVFVVSFDPGEKCSVSAPSSLGSGMIYYEIKARGQTPSTYGVLFQTLDEGKTLDDLLAYPKTATEPPSWDHVFHEAYVGAGSTSYYAEEFPPGQFYISCFISTKGGIERILDYGPIEAK